MYPISAVSTYGYQTTAQSSSGKERGIVRIRFDTASMNGGAADGSRLMMFSMPHHRTHLLSPSLPATTGPRVRMDDLRGELSHVLGNDWVLGYDLPSLPWSNRAIPDAARRSAIASQLISDAYGWTGSVADRDDMYYGASDLAALGSMISIATELLAVDANAGLASARGLLQSRLAFRLGERLATSARRSSLVYDTTWGGLIGYGDASTNREYNFGNRWV